MPKIKNSFEEQGSGGGQTTMMSRKSRTDMIRLAVLLTIISYVHDHLTYSPNPHTVLPQGNTSSLLSSGRVVVAVTLTR